MAQKRMFSLNVVDTDRFLEMPITSRLLYYELGMRADDDGFVDNWKKILMFTGLKEDDLKVLIAKSFIIPFESGVIVIRHWRMNNYLQNDRTKPTVYQDELSMLKLDKNTNVYTLDTSCIHSIEENSIEKNRLEYSSSKEEQQTIFDYYQQEIGSLSPRQYEILNNYCNYLSEEVVKIGINKTADSNAKSFNYLESILKVWKQKGYKTLGDVQNEKRIKKEKDIPEWFDKEIKEEKISEEEENDINELLKEVRMK